MNPTFVLDVHLAKLARHLRMVGLDSLWSSEFADAELLRILAAEGRVLLTRDRALHDQAPQTLRHYVAATDPDEQFKEVITRFGLWPHVRSHAGFLSRCLECNSAILPVKPHQLADRLPGHVREEYSEFFLCPRCERTYWKGGHVERMKALVDRLADEASQAER